VRCCGVLLVSALLLAGCGEPVDRACPAVYSPAGVLFKLPSRAQFTEPVEFRACADQGCVTSDDKQRRLVGAVAGRRIWPRHRTPDGDRATDGDRPQLADRAARRVHTGHPAQDRDDRLRPRAGGYQAIVHAANGTLVPG
jgi:hypothetical protein